MIIETILKMIIDLLYFVIKCDIMLENGIPIIKTKTILIKRM